MGTATAGRGIGFRDLRPGVAVIALLAVAGATSPASSDPPVELLVGAAISLRGPLTSIAELFESRYESVTVVMSFGASSAIANQIRAGAPIDVFASADERLALELVEQDFLDPSELVVIAGNRLVVIVAADIGFSASSPLDLLRPELRRIAIPDRAVPVGYYAHQWLHDRGILERLASRSLQTEHALATLRVVDAGNADAALVYATDARLARSARVAFEIPEHEQPDIRYVVAPVTTSAAFDHAARFARFVVEPAAQQILFEAGFTRPSPARADEANE